MCFLPSAQETIFVVSLTTKQYEKNNATHFSNICTTAKVNVYTSHYITILYYKGTNYSSK
jgi:hypothetical protein